MCVALTTHSGHKSRTRWVTPLVTHDFSYTSDDPSELKGKLHKYIATPTRPSSLVVQRHKGGNRTKHVHDTGEAKDFRALPPYQLRKVYVVQG
jgi:hypothetical protein